MQPYAISEIQNWQTDHTITIQDREFIIKRNLRTIRQLHWENGKQYEHYDQTNDSSESPTILFLFETPLHDAFVHWVYESAVFLKYAQYFDGAKILVNTYPERNYKKLFMKMLGIDQTHVIYYENQPHQDYPYRDIPPNNICIVCKNLMMNTLFNYTHTENRLFIKRVRELKQDICNGCVLENTKSIDALFLPRNKEQNLTINNRAIDYLPVHNMLKQIQSAYSHAVIIQYDSLTTMDFLYQIQLLRASKIVFLDYGSSLYINGLFCYDSTIYVSGFYEPENLTCQMDYNYYYLLIEEIYKDNRVVFIPPKQFI